MKVLLKKVLPPNGKPGDVISVSDSYAQNFLLPRGIAIVATTTAMLSAEAAKKRITIQQQATKKDHEELAARFANLTLHVSARASAQGKLYAAVQEVDIIRALQQEYQLRAAGLRFGGLPIKSTGLTQIVVRFAAGPTVSLTVEVALLP